MALEWCRVDFPPDPRHSIRTAISNAVEREISNVAVLDAHVTVKSRRAAIVRSVRTNKTAIVLSAYSTPQRRAVARVSRVAFWRSVYWRRRLMFSVWPYGAS